METPHNIEMNPIGLTCLTIGWISGIIGVITVQHIPIILSCLTSAMAIYNYYLQIRKNRNK